MTTMSESYIPSVWNTLGRAGKWIIKKKTNTSMSTVMKNIMIITNTVITSISTMSTVPVGMTMKKKIAV